MAVDVTWEDVLYSIDNMLAETENQDDNPNLGYHEASLLLNRLEMALSVLCSLLDTDLDLDRNTRQVLSQLCSLLTEIYQYWDEKVIQMRHRTVLFTRFGSKADEPFSKPGKTTPCYRQGTSRRSLKLWLLHLDRYCKDATNLTVDVV